MRSELGRLTIVGAHSQGLFMHVSAVPREGETVLGSAYDEPADGGKATNQAVAAARLGAPVALVTVVGRDARGRSALEYLSNAGVDTRWVIHADGPTDVGFVMLPPSRIPAITSSQDRSRELTPDAVSSAADVIREASLVVCQLEAPQETAIAAFRIAREVGARTILNPAPASELDPDLLSLVDVVVPNEHEAATLAGRKASSAELAQELVERWSVHAVIVTAGSDGAYVATDGNRPERVPAPDVDVIDTTGAGDAFVGALATQLRAGADLVEAARFAVRVASLSVTRFGTIPAYPTLEEVAS